MHKIYREKDKIIIEIPFTQTITNPYDDTESKMDNIAGVIAGEEMGFVHLVDRSYKGKEPDITDFFYHYWGGEKEFKDLCSKLKIQLIILPICSKCGEVIFGACIIDKRGKDLCFDCETKLEK